MSFGQRTEFDKRRENRRKTLLRAELVFHDGASAVSGLVRNLSSGGARFVLDHAVDVPDRVNLLFPSGEEYPCEVARRIGEMEFGLRFIGEADFDPVKASGTLGSIYASARQLAPHELQRMLRSVHYFRDKELEESVQRYVALYNTLMDKLGARMRQRRDAGEKNTDMPI